MLAGWICPISLDRSINTTHTHTEHMSSYEDEADGAVIPHRPPPSSTELLYEHSYYNDIEMCEEEDTDSFESNTTTTATPDEDIEPTNDYGFSSLDNDDDSSTVSSLSMVTATTDRILLQFYGGQQILSLRPPQPEQENSTSPPLRPPTLGKRTFYAAAQNTQHTKDETVKQDELDHTTIKSVPSESLEENDETEHVQEKGFLRRSNRMSLFRRIALFTLLLGVIVGAVIIVKPGKTGQSSPESEAGQSTQTNTSKPTSVQLQDSERPSTTPSNQPSTQPTWSPSQVPSISPTELPTSKPTAVDQLVFIALESVLNNFPVFDDHRMEALQWVIKNTNPEIHSEPRIRQRYTLALLYLSTNGKNWTEQDEWLESDNECNWHSRRVSACNAQNELVFLDIPANNARGTLPPELSVLSPALIELKLNGNLLTGSIPSSLSRLSKLEVLDISNGMLTGIIPDSLGNLSNLRIMNLSKNPSLGGTFPGSLSDLPFLEELYVSQTNLSEPINESICELDLKSFWVDGCDNISCPCCTYCCYGNLCQKTNN